ncbi:MAG: helix-turn-helix domain-containing protein [Oscillospiraceae bacterium]|nr:helix-turn-helix domain-containing protein [Oscillospiraceae bacterium]
MKESTYNTYDDLPLFLNAETAAALLGVSISSMYELMHEKGFPVLRIGSRLVIPKDKLRAWVEQNTGK